ncbi:MAG: hypothetical protein MUC45_08760 [Actinomycetia bacterium]|jgi:hypothetical protein|nr:hypothetical protein [Actinomycetes bacterium]
MGRIQVDMFEVQLGAGLLLQFDTPDGPVRVLADAGVKAGGYPPDHVHRKLPGAFDAFDAFDASVADGAGRRLDLVIGTHYDEDHLIGLVPVIADESLAIGEAWLPPVADDSRPPPPDRPLGGDDLLVTALAGPDRAARLTAHLRAKHEVCQLAAQVERAADAVRPDRPRSVRPDQRLLAGTPRSGGDVTAWRRVFEAHAEDAAVTLGPLLADASHAGGPDEAHDLPGPAARRSRTTAWAGGSDALARAWADPSRASADATDLATIRRAAARDAINALALAEVVAALADRGIAIRCPTIPDGMPQQYRWRPGERRFAPSGGRASHGLSLTLLGPSEGLVRRHWTRLPVGDYVTRAREAAIPIQWITPSNQLSLVTRFDFAGQAVLVVGDSGFVDFTAPEGGYHPRLLAALLPLQVVQVAHHAGNNAHFYRALLAAGWAEQPGQPLLLVSHATRDRHRPSPAFGQFLAALRDGPADPRVVFTSKPSVARVRSFRDAIHPVVGTSHLVGDARLVCDDGTWTVARHAIRG